MIYDEDYVIAYREESLLPAIFRILTGDCKDDLFILQPLQIVNTEEGSNISYNYAMLTQDCSDNYLPNEQQKLVVEKCINSFIDLLGHYLESLDKVKH